MVLSLGIPAVLSLWSRLKDNKRSSSAVLSYLKKENDYLAAVLADTKFTQQQLCTEMHERTQEEDISAPLRVKGYYYYTKTLKGKERKIHCRRKVDLSDTLIWMSCGVGRTKHWTTFHCGNNGL